MSDSQTNINPVDGNSVINAISEPGKKISRLRQEAAALEGHERA